MLAGVCGGLAKYLGMDSTVVRVIYVLASVLTVAFPGILFAMFLSSLLHLQGAAKIAGYVCGIVVLSYTAEPWSYAFYRVVETFLGIAMAVVVSLVPKLLRVDIPAETDSSEGSD